MIDNDWIASLGKSARHVTPRRGMVHSDESSNLTIPRLLVCSSAEDLRSDAQWDGAFGNSRQHLLQEISSMSILSRHERRVNEVL